MLRIALSAAMFAAVAGAPQVMAGSWGFGFGLGPYRHYGPPPGYYRPGPPPYYDEGPYTILGPAEADVSADEVFDMLEDDGYSDFGPMAHRGPVYRLRAVNPDGDLVDLEISAFTGEIDREVILADARRAPPPAAAPAAPVAPRNPAPAPKRPQKAEKKPSSEERDPLVVY